MHIVRIVVCAALAALVQWPATADAGDVREFQINAMKFAFEPDRIEVTEGDTVRLIVRSTDSTHGLGIKPFDIKREIPKTGEPVTVEFVASQAGEFEIACSKWCGKGHKKMKAVLVVKPRAATH
jgi:cytochrome c oxidase subunit II